MCKEIYDPINDKIIIYIPIPKQCIIERIFNIPKNEYKTYYNIDDNYIEKTISKTKHKSKIEHKTILKTEHKSKTEHKTKSKKVSFNID